MTFEEYWTERTCKENDVIHNLWVANIELGKVSLGNQLYHSLKEFAREIWEESRSRMKS